MKNTLRSRGGRALAACAMIACIVFSRANAGETIARDVAARAQAATVMVYIAYGEPFENSSSWGTGFVVGDGLIMTNAHVVSDRVPKRVYVRNDFLPPTEARILAARYDTNEFANASVVEYVASTLIGNAGMDGVSLSKPFTNYDIALLAFTPPPGVRLPALPLSLDAAPNQGVYAVGYPGGGRPAVEFAPHAGAAAAPVAPIVITGGVVNQIINRDPLLLMHDALCKTGNSGGPLINERGEVVGMQTWSAAPDRRNIVTSFAIGARDLAAFAENAGYRLATTGRGAPRRSRTGGADARAHVLANARAGDANYMALAGLLHYLGDCGFSRDENGAVDYLAGAIERDPGNANAYLYRAGLAAILARSPRLASRHRADELLRSANNSAAIGQGSLHPDHRLLAFESALLMQGRASGFAYDPRRSLLLAEKALEGGFALPLALTGYHYYFGDAGGTRDHDEALFRAREAARSGVPEGVSLLAHLYYDSDAVPRSAASLRVARLLAEEAARLDEPWALGLLANIYYDSDNPAERARAPEFASRGAHFGNRMAFYCLGRIAWDAFLANPGDMAQAAKAWAFIELAERKGVRVALPGGNGGGIVLRSSLEILAAFPPNVREWLLAEGRREQQSIAA